MGYTNYWRRLKKLPAKKFAAAVHDCEKLMKHLEVPLAGFDGTGSPIFQPHVISFNGVGSEGYESFGIERSATGRDDDARVFEFCKTNQRSYDLCVQTALIALKHHLGKAIIVSSDGKECDWNNARNVCQKWLGYGGEFRLE